MLESQPKLKKSTDPIVMFAVRLLMVKYCSCSICFMVCVSHSDVKMPKMALLMRGMTSKCDFSLYIYITSLYSLRN